MAFVYLSLGGDEDEVVFNCYLKDGLEAYSEKISVYSKAIKIISSGFKLCLIQWLFPVLLAPQRKEE
ncbi:MAG: hypothetical protein WCJ54_01195 [Actinomycetota bacterium]